MPNTAYYPPVPARPTSARPERSTATQIDGDGQDTAANGVEPSDPATPHAPPAQVRTEPASSTPAQNVVVGHDTPVRYGPIDVVEAAPGSTRTGADQLDPFQTSTPPVWLAATQNDAVAHVTDVKADDEPSGWGVVHEEPFHWEIPPETDTQNDDETQAIWATDPQSPLVWCHPWPDVAKANPSASTAAQ